MQNTQTVSLIDWTAVSAMATIIYTLITAAGTWFVANSFLQQKEFNNHQKDFNKAQININALQTEILKQQKILNDLALANEERKDLPIFKLKNIKVDQKTYLMNAFAHAVNIWSFDINGKVVNQLIYNGTLDPDPEDGLVLPMYRKENHLVNKPFIIIQHKDKVGRIYIQVLYHHETQYTFPEKCEEESDPEELYKKTLF